MVSITIKSTPLSLKISACCLNVSYAWSKETFPNGYKYDPMEEMSPATKEPFRCACFFAMDTPAKIISFILFSRLYCASFNLFAPKVFARIMSEPLLIYDE